MSVLYSKNLARVTWSFVCFWVCVLVCMSWLLWLPKVSEPVFFCVSKYCVPFKLFTHRTFCIKSLQDTSWTVLVVRRLDTSYLLQRLASETFRTFKNLKCGFRAAFKLLFCSCKSCRIYTSTIQSVFFELPFPGTSVEHKPSSPPPSIPLFSLPWYSVFISLCCKYPLTANKSDLLAFTEFWKWIECNSHPRRFQLWWNIGLRCQSYKKLDKCGFLRYQLWYITSWGKMSRVFL